MHEKRILWKLECSFFKQRKINLRTKCTQYGTICFLFTNWKCSWKGLFRSQNTFNPNYFMIQHIINAFHSQNTPSVKNISILFTAFLSSNTAFHTILFIQSTVWLHLIPHKTEFWKKWSFSNRLPQTFSPAPNLDHWLSRCYIGLVGMFKHTKCFESSKVFTLLRDINLWMIFNCL